MSNFYLRQLQERERMAQRTVERLAKQLKNTWCAVERAMIRTRLRGARIVAQNDCIRLESALLK